MNLDELKAKLSAISSKPVSAATSILVPVTNNGTSQSNAAEIDSDQSTDSLIEEINGRVAHSVNKSVPTNNGTEKLVECECCPNSVPEVDIKKFHNMKMCPSCYANEMKLQQEHNTPAKQQERVDIANANIERIKAIDHQVNLRQDIFNAETVAIHTIIETVNSDSTIPADKKQFTIGKAIKDRIEHFQKVIFDLTELQVQENNKLRAAVTYFNELQYKLRAEEREQLKLADLNYKPTPPKLVTPTEKKVRTGRTGPKKFSANLLREASAKLAIWCVENGYKIMTMDAVQMISTARNMSPDEAVEFIKSNPSMLTKN